MADTKITGLSTDTAPDAADVFPFVDVSAATTEKVTYANMVPKADVSATNTGTSATSLVTPDGLAGSYAGTESVTVEVFAAATALATGDGKKYFKLPSTVNGMNLVAVSASVFAKSTSGNPTVMLARGRQANATTAHAYVDMLSTALTIDANDFDSKDAGTPAVINGSNDDVLTGDMVRVDVDTAGTAATGLFVTLEFRLP